MNIDKLPKVSALLFDLGGVLVEIDWIKVFDEWSKYSRLSTDEIANRFRMDKAYQRHECGQISGSEYFLYLRDIVEYQGDEDSFIEGWNSIFVGLINKSVNILDQIDRELPLYLLTNTNVTHEIKWMMMYSALIARFNKVFVSSSMGCRKPDKKAFEHVLEEMNVTANEVLFFDDTKENVEGAKAIGFQVVHVIRPSDIRIALTEHKIFAP